MALTTKKQFIAGVTCPKCAQMDKIQAYVEDGVNYRECVSCGFKDQMRLASAPREMQTRVNTTQEEIASQTQTVRLMDPKD
ncbi:MAG: YheV family putative zinc ribbon protein [Porticoccaceae bacterium]